MKTNPTILEAIKADNLHIIDEDGVPFETEEENDLIHQERADENIDHASELALDKWFKKQKLEDEQEYLWVAAQFS